MAIKELRYNKADFKQEFLAKNFRFFSFAKKAESAHCAAY